MTEVIEAVAPEAPQIPASPAPVSRRRLPGDFKLWELVLLLVGGMLFSASAFLYFSGASPRAWLLGETTDDGGLVVIGSVGKISGGGLKRQTRLEGSFSRLKDGASVHNGDTLMTAEDGGAEVLLKDGSALQLGPGTLVRLSSESSVGLTGVKRAASLDVVKGQVSGDAAASDGVVLRSGDQVVSLRKGGNEAFKVAAVPIIKPAVRALPPKVLSSASLGGSESFSAAKLSSDNSPSVTRPSPAAPLAAPRVPAVPKLSPSFDVKWLEPVTGQKFSSLEGQGPKVGLKWQLIEGAPATRLQVFFGKEEKPVLERAWKDGEASSTGEALLDAERPGSYRVVLEAGPKKVESELYVESAFNGLKLQPFRVAGSTEATNQLKDTLIRKPLDATLSWKPIGKVRGPYRVRVFRNNVEKPIIDTQVTGTSYVLKGTDLLEGGLSYRVEARAVGAGFIPMSELQPIEFKVVPPTPARPTSGASFSLTGLRKSQGSFLLTWVVTNFTERYEVEIGSGAQGTIYQAADNFMVYKPSAAGSFWWRVRGVTSGKQSVWSETRTFVIKP
jgi:hypothetical protein